MSETRAQAQKTASTVRELEEAFGSRFDQMLGRTQALEGTVASQNSRMEKAIADMFEAIKLLTTTQGAASEPTGLTSQSGLVQTIEQNQVRLDLNRGFRTGSPQNYAGMTRLAKLEFPRFNGDRLKDWLFKVEQFFELDHTPPESKVNLTAIHLDDIAATWHQAVIQSDNGHQCIRDWATYKTLLKERFNDSLDDPIAELKLLQETQGISDYHASFENIRTRVHLSEAYLVSAYLAGLRWDTQMHIRMFQPQSVHHCFLLGRLYESAHPGKSTAPSGTPPRSTNATNSTRPSYGKGTTAVRQDIALVPHSLPADKNKENQQRKFLSTREMSERRAKGLCYFCDEKYTLDHYLKHKKTQLFLLETEVEEGDEIADQPIDEEMITGDIARISVNAMAGISDYNTMRVKGTHGKRTLFVLIDSGSTHNFLNPVMAEKLNVKMHPASTTRVSVADGRKLDVLGKVKNFDWWFQGTAFQANFMVLPLGGCDMVLGIQWLQALGTITWDFMKLIMQF